MPPGASKLKHIDLSKPTPSVKGIPAPVLGRNQELLNQRNLKIAVRYYYHNALKKTNVHSTIQALVYEFDLNSYTIERILRKEADVIIEMKKNRTSVSALRKEYHWYQW